MLNYDDGLIALINKGKHILSIELYVLGFLCLYVLIAYSDEPKGYICYAFAFMVSVFMYMFKDIVPKQLSFLPLFIYTFAAWANMFESSRVFNMAGITGDIADWIRLSLLTMAVYHSYRSLISTDTDTEFDEWTSARILLTIVMAITFLKEIYFLFSCFIKVSESIGCEWMYCIIFTVLFFAIHLQINMPDTVFINKNKLWKYSAAYTIVSGMLIGLYLFRDKFGSFRPSKYVIAMWIAFILIMTFISFLMIGFVIKPGIFLLKNIIVNPFWLEHDFKYISTMCADLKNRDLTKEYRHQSLFFNIYDLERLADIQQELITVLEMRMQIFNKEEVDISEETAEILLFMEKSLISQITDYQIKLR